MFAQKDTVNIHAASTPSSLYSGLSRTGIVAELRRLVSREVWLATAFLLVNFVLGILWFVVLVTLISLGVGLAYTLVGLVILALAMRLWMAGADLERKRLAAFLGVPVPAPYRPLTERGPISRMLALAGDSAVWRDLLYLVLLFPLGTVEGALVIIAWSLLLGGIAALVYLPYYWLTAGAPFPSLLDYTLATLPVIVLAVLTGLVMAMLVPRCVVAMARAHALLAQMLLRLSPDREVLLTRRVDELRESRSRLLDAALLERRRIERDLHDGAQQRLVSVALSLGMAREKMRTDPESAAALVEEAHEQTKQAIRDIRDFVRGIHPAVLSDRGLDAAISALAGQCPVPVEVHVALDSRPSEAVESTAYFVVAEALTNVARHSNSAHVRINVSRIGDQLILETIDDGRGGAVIGAGSGLMGLRDRVAALDGHLIVDSPPGGPTRIRVEIPFGVS